MRGIGGVIKAAGYSWAGLKAAWKHEESFRLEVVLALVLIPLALWLTDNAIERVLLIGSVMLVLIIELLNSALETLVDRVSTEHHALSGRAKDIGSAAVFVAMVNAGLVWGLIVFFI